MINPNGSNIPEARRLLVGVLNRADLSEDDAEDIRDALVLMKRQGAIKVASTKQRIKVTAAVRDNIKVLVTQFPDSTNAEIAVMAGLPSSGSGRVSEVMQGLYDHL